MESLLIVQQRSCFCYPNGTLTLRALQVMAMVYIAYAVPLRTCFEQPRTPASLRRDARGRLASKVDKLVKSPSVAGAPLP